MKEIKSLEEFGKLCAEVAANSRPTNWQIDTYVIAKELLPQLTPTANGVIRVPFDGKTYEVRRKTGSKAETITNLNIGTCTADHTNPISKIEWKVGQKFYSWD